MDESQYIEEEMARYHAEIAAQPKRRAPSRDADGGSDQVGALAFAGMLTVFLGSSGYILFDVESKSTTMITNGALGAGGSHFAVAVLIEVVLCMPFMISSFGTLLNRLFLGVVLGVFGSMSLGIALDGHAERGAEAAIFAQGGSRTAEAFPIEGTSVHRGRGVSYWATVLPPGRTRTLEMSLSLDDFNRIGRSLTDPAAPDRRMCVKFEVETRGSDRRILWSKYDSIPSAWIKDC